MQRHPGREVEIGESRRRYRGRLKKRGGRETRPLPATRPVTNGTISPPPRFGLANVPAVIRREAIWPQAGDVAYFRVVKTALSRGRTGRTLNLAGDSAPKVGAKSFVLSRWSNFCIFPPS